MAGSIHGPPPAGTHGTAIRDGDVRAPVGRARRTDVPAADRAPCGACGWRQFAENSQRALQEGV
ncbi:hypothetical protein AC230_15895 [Streptomyces caatingaensis]|uniref:Uncharacterized protein n=1 Tax=Streptomyces caatingaensis TaxID=1678637 RepID=A0A0K9XGK2_9ACTN|nr:hypothetical protein AC230_15895 [Streptomyces caatingaensis]